MKQTLCHETILNSLEQNIFVKDLEFTYIFSNATYANLINQEPASVIGKNDYDFFPEEIASKYRKDDEFIIKNEESIDVKEDILVGDSHKTIRTIKKPLYKDGNIIGIIGIFWDITDSEAQKSKFKKLQDGLSKAQELAHIGHWELDLVENKLFWSDEVYRIFGLKPQEFGATYEAFLEHIHPDDRDLVNNAYSESIEKKEGYNVTHRIVRKGGEIGFVEERCIHEFNEDGEVIRSIGTVHDITQKKKAENELMLATNVFAKMHDAVMVTDPQQNIISVNEAFTKITGYTKDEIVGKTPKVLSSGWHDSIFYEALWDSIYKNGQWEGEIIDRKKDGQRYTADLKITSIYNDDGVLTNYIAISNDITKKKEQEKLIHNLAYFDPLTELPNRILFEERVTHRIPLLKRSEQKMAIIFVDMDNFKNINDTLGHSSGDKFLIEASKKIKHILREQDTLARLGGDEFTIMIESFESIESVARIAERIVEVFKEPFYLDANKVFSGVSLGISVYPDDAKNYNELMKAADTAMYQVKESGKKNYKFYQPSMNETITKRILIENNLHSAIKNGEFFLEYQPKVDIQNNIVYGMEALIRWNQPEQGLVRPDEFISVAEDTGLIYDIGLFVFRQAVSDLKELHKDFNRLVVSVNVSNKQLENKNFVDDISNIINEVGVDKSFVELEITESHIMDDIDKTLVVLNELSFRGFKLSIDDFGTGYSSLSYLKKLPAQTIKIDRSFVLDIDKDEDDRSIVASIIAMARTLGKDVIAEGSETQEHIETLKFMHCGKVQGYFFSKPLKLEEFTKYVQEF